MTDAELDAEILRLAAVLPHATTAPPVAVRIVPYTGFGASTLHRGVQTARVVNVVGGPWVCRIGQDTLCAMAQGENATAARWALHGKVCRLLEDYTASLSRAAEDKESTARALIEDARTARTQAAAVDRVLATAAKREGV